MIEPLYASESFINVVLNLGTSKQSFPRQRITIDAFDVNESLYNNSGRLL